VYRLGNKTKLEVSTKAQFKLGFVVGVNGKSWDALLNDIKGILDKAASQATVEIALVCSWVLDNALIKGVADYGVKFHTEAIQARVIAIAEE
jgi:TRAP-type C4-dicarboxylate transport system substrate-binding protein